MPVPELSTKPPTAPLMPYTDLMNKQPLIRQGAFLVSETAAADLACQEAMAAYAARLQAEEAYRQAVRHGEIAPPQVQFTNWYISDRH